MKLHDKFRRYGPQKWPKILPSTVTSDRGSTNRLRFLIDKIIRADKTVVDKTHQVSLAIIVIAYMFAQCIKKKDIYTYIRILIILKSNSARDLF